MSKSKQKGKSPAVDVAKSVAKAAAGTEIITLTTGVRVRLKAVAGSLLDKVIARVEEPEVPMQFVDEKEREEPNPSDPKYLAALSKARQHKGEVALDAMIMFGVELVDGIPDDDGWLDKLKLLEKLGTLELSTYDLENPLEKEFIYKKFVAVSSQDMLTLGKLSGIREEDVAEAIESFPGDEA